MAKKTSVVLVDDLDGSEADETVSFALDGEKYEIDVTNEHAAQLRDALAPYIGAARRAGKGGAAPAQRRGSGGGARRSSGGAAREKTQEIRDWARSNGHQVNDRGRLSGKVIEAYEAAH